MEDFQKLKQRLTQFTILHFIFLLLIITVQISLVGCRSMNGFKAPETIPDDRQKISKPKSSKINIVADIIDKQFDYQLENSLDLSRQLRSLFGKQKQAMNVDAFDEVADSSWFTNRNAKNRLTLEQIARGPNTLNGPDDSGAWTIFRAKEE